MSKNNNSRRTFTKSIGLLALSPWWPQVDNTKKIVLTDSVKSAEHNILSCNIRVALPQDDEAGVGWNDRKEACIDIIHQHQPDIICMQEVLKVQNEDLKKAFPKYFSFGFEGPEMDAFQTGYHGIAKNPIFFSQEKYDMLSAGGYWLSETPLLGGSKSWGTARARHVNWVRLIDKKSKKDFRVVNLHLDHKSQEAREKQIALVIKECSQYDHQYPQILAGDFNAGALNPVYDIIKQGNWQDTYTALHGTEEPGYTTHQFKGKDFFNGQKGRKIDFIFSRGAVEPEEAKIIKDQYNGRYPSDHYFISAAVKFL